MSTSNVVIALRPADIACISGSSAESPASPMSCARHPFLWGKQFRLITPLYAEKTRIGLGATTGPARETIQGKGTLIVLYTRH